MIRIIGPTLAAAALTIGFAGIGESLTGRRARSLGDLNRAFLIGGGVLAAALFPASLLFGGRALGVELGAAGAGFLVFWVRHLLGSFNVRGAMKWLPSRVEPLTLLLAAPTIVMMVIFAVLNLRTGLLWDGFQIWATKGFLLFHDGALHAELWNASDLIGRAGRIVNYPSLIPLFEALQARLTGHFVFDQVSPVFQIFHVSLIMGTWEAARRLTGRTGAWFASSLVALLPEISTGTAAGGYADMPQAAVIAAALAAAADPHERRASWRAQVPWLCVAVMTVKSEGTLLVVVAVTMALLVMLTQRRGRDRLPLRSFVPWVGIVGSAFALRIVHLAWNHHHDDLFVTLNGAAFIRALHRFPEVVGACSRVLADPRLWGVFWLAVLAVAARSLIHDDGFERWLSAFVIADVLVFSAVFLFSTWPVALHVSQAYSRLLAQVAPVGAVTLTVGLWRPLGAQWHAEQ